MTDEDDPLAGADIGETVTVEHETDLWLGGVPDSEVVRGADRAAEYRLGDAEVVTDDVGDRLLRVTVESDVTKQLPRNWDQEPREPTATATPPEQSTLRQAAGVVIGVAVSVGVGVSVFQRVSGSLAGESVTFGPQPSLLDLAAPVVLLFVLTTLIVFGIQYLPRPGPRGGRV